MNDQSDSLWRNNICLIINNVHQKHLKYHLLLQTLHSNVSVAASRTRPLRDWLPAMSPLPPNRVLHVRSLWLPSQDALFCITYHSRRPSLARWVLVCLLGLDDFSLCLFTYMAVVLLLSVCISWGGSIGAKDISQNIEKQAKCNFVKLKDLAQHYCIRLTASELLCVCARIGLSSIECVPSENHQTQIDMFLWGRRLSQSPCCDFGCCTSQCSRISFGLKA